MAEESAMFESTQPVGAFEGNLVARPVHLQCVEHGFRPGDMVGVDHDRRLRHADGQRLDIGYALVKGARRSGIAHRLVEQIGKIIEQRILLLNLQSENPIEKSWDVALVVLPNPFPAVL
jgi:hypothetical protein